MVMAGCFQLDTIDHSAPTPPTPPVIEYESLYPPINRVITFRLDGPPADFYIPHIFDANGFEEDQLFGRWFVNYEPTTTASVHPFVVERQDAPVVPEDPDAGTTEDDCPCEGCCWKAQFKVNATDFSGDGCYRILAYVSDSRFKEEFGHYHEAENPDAYPAQVTWWVWAYSGEAPDSPAFEECADRVEVNP